MSVEKGSTGRRDVGRIQRDETRRVSRGEKDARNRPSRENDAPSRNVSSGVVLTALAMSRREMVFLCSRRAFRYPRSPNFLMKKSVAHPMRKTASERGNQGELISSQHPSGQAYMGELTDLCCKPGPR